METAARRGEGEEIVSVRPYRAGDPMNRIHWRTSARRGELYTMELDSQVQSEIGVYLDLTRGARFGSGAESTTEIAIGCAVSILTEAATLRHRVSLAWVRSRLEAFPSGAGAAHLHMLLDRLATVSFGGERPFWIDIAEPVSLLKAGSRAIFIAPAATTPAKPTSALVRRLVLQGVAADVILLDESRLMRVFSSQDPTHKEAEKEFARLRRTLERAGARVLPLAKGEGAARLMPAATEEPAAQTARRA
jgi:uncharacterized protein (DUF58 family)